MVTETNIRQERLFLLRQYKKALKGLTQAIRLELEAIEQDGLEDFRSSEAISSMALDLAKSQIRLQSIESLEVRCQKSR